MTLARGGDERMEFGIGLMGEHPPHRMRTLCPLIEASGLDQIWVSDERFYRDVFVNMTLAVGLTHRVKVGSMVTDPFVRHPAVTAAAAASVDEVSGGRCVLGMGAGISGFHEMGIQRVRPARAIKEAVQLIHRLTSGEKAIAFEGQSVQFRGGHLNFPPLRPVPVYVAGRGPKVLEIAGEVADGVVIASYASQRGIEWGLDHAARGARRGGRRLEDIIKMSWLYTSISSDGERARDAVRTGVAVAMWGSREILPQIGVQLPANVLRVMEDRSYSYEVIAELAHRLPDALLEEFSVAGTAMEVASKLIQIGRMGIAQAALWLFPPEGEDFETVLRSLNADVLPRVRSALDRDAPAP
jgi:5,10-methylenetetrahydromethanopterin reductase